MEAESSARASFCKSHHRIASRPAARAAAASERGAAEAQLFAAVEYVNRTGCSPAEAIVLNRFDMLDAQQISMALARRVTEEGALRRRENELLTETEKRQLRRAYESNFLVIGAGGSKAEVRFLSAQMHNLLVQRGRDYTAKEKTFMTDYAASGKLLSKAHCQGIVLRIQVSLDPAPSPWTDQRA